MRRFDRASAYCHVQGQTLADPFAVNPIRRAAALCLSSGAIVFVPWQISSELGTSVMVTVGWLALTGLIFGLPILVMSLIEAGMAAVRNRLHPPLEHLGLSPRVLHVLRRHGYFTIQEVRQAPDGVLLSLSNMDDRGLREIRKQLALTDYRQWQDAGFPLNQ